MSIFSRTTTDIYHIDGVSETRNLRTGKCVLHGINVNKIAGVASTLIIYDSLTAGGKVIGKWDLNVLNSLGSFTFGTQSIDCTIGLTYITTGILANFSVSIIWNNT